ncbi:MAG TPA: sulfotransferase [Fimbriimonadaceae bacterium]|jgi:tetratricopeptide (TPR) repeat protein
MSEDSSLLAEQAFSRGDYDETERICREILKKTSQSAPATLLLGMAALKKRRLNEAVDLLKAALHLSPNDYLGTTWLLGALYESSRYGEAIELGIHAGKLWPQDVDVLLSLSQTYMMANEVEAAKSCLESVVRLQPANPMLRCKLGGAYELLARDGEAAIQYKKAIAAQPRMEEAYFRLGHLLLAQGSYTEAVELCKSGLSILARPAHLHLLYAQALRKAQEPDLSEEHLQKAISLDPKITLAAAKWLEEDGRFAEAAALLEKAKDLKLSQGSVYYGIIKGRKMSKSDRPLLQELENLLDTPLSLQERATVYYALGKAADDLGEYEKSMNHFDEANALSHRIHLSGHPFDAERHRKWVNQTIEMATPELFRKYRNLGCKSDLPIFIIGMIRSGTSLTEQIIASHPEVGGAGEQRYWLSEWPGLVNLEKQTINPAKFIDARDRYLALLRGIEPEKRHVTDKMPMNFFVIWLIHLAYPNAKIIHVKRNPVDTALSIYMTDLAKPPEYAHIKKNIVAAYRDYEKLMAHFSSVIPEQNLMTLQYECLIADQEFWTRKLLEFCNLNWDPKCLEFYANERLVTTPSRRQVRQPIYKSSMEKWRNFGPWLGDFAELLEDDLDGS